MGNRFARLLTTLCICTLTFVLISGWCTLVVEGKTHTNLLTAEEIATLRANKTWSGSISTASRWMNYSIAELRDKVPPASVPRAFDTHQKQDPLHPEEILAFGKYPWIIDPDLPYKVKCPVSGEIYPTNDFDPKNVGKPNEVSSEPYVDNGWGWKDPNDSQKYWFVAYYAHWMYHNFLRPAALAMGQAYITTGDQAYARQAAALLDRIAEEYPQMDYVKQSRFGTEIMPGAYHGRILNLIWETGMVRDLATAYDYIYEGLDGDAELEKALGKSIAEIKRNIEVNLLKNAAQSIYGQDDRIRGNFGMHQSALATIAIVLDDQDTERYLDFVLHANGVGLWVYDGIVTGLANFIYRDGAPNESSPGYNSIWTGQFNSVAELMLARNVNLYQDEPKLRSLFEYPLRLVMIGKYSPNIGDTGGVKSSGIIGWASDTYMTAYKQYGVSQFLSGQALTTESDNMSAYGLAMLRSNRGINASGLVMYYGQGGGHGHFDRLGIEYFAKGQRISPDIGYPDYASNVDKKRFAFVSHTVSHNTVMVDAQRQPNKDGGNIQVFNATPKVQYVDVRAEDAYPGKVDLYRRSLALISVSESDAYTLDVFRVSGGKQHDYSLHGPDGTFSAENIALTAQATGTVAGESVPFGYLYDAVHLESPSTTNYGSYTGSGFSYLKNVEKGMATGVWDADWTVAGTSSTHFRATFVPQPETQVFVADGEPPQNVSGNPKTIKYVLARTTNDSGTDLESKFVTVLQPYQGTPFIKKVTSLVDADQDTVALRIDHTEGVDYVAQSMTRELFVSESHDFRLQGALGVVSWSDGGILRYANLVGGTLLHQGDITIEAAGDYRGEVISVDYEACKVIIQLDIDSPSIPVGEVLRNQRIVFSNDLHSTEYTVASVRYLGNQRYELQTVEQEMLTGTASVSVFNSRNLISSAQLALGQYYIGQTLVNPANGKGARITSVMSSQNFSLERSDLDLKYGDTFNIHDFGSGDRFAMTASVHIDADTQGRYTVTSNVAGKVTLWDGSQHVIEPGVAQITLPLIQVSISQPKYDARVAGVFTPSFTIDTPDTLKLNRVKVSLMGNELPTKVIYESETVPAVGSVALNTMDVPDGDYVLVVTATDHYGKSVSAKTPFKIENWWHISTELDEPISSGWFGNLDFTHIYEKSTGWRFVKEEYDNFLGDNNRMVRAATRKDYIIWEGAKLQEIELRVFTRDGLSLQEITLSISGNGSDWQPLTYNADAGATSKAGWQQWTLKAQVPAGGVVNYFRLEVDDTVPADQFQVGRVDMAGYTDPLTVGTYAY
jgi:hypothetical protein